MAAQTTTRVTITSVETGRVALGQWTVEVGPLDRETQMAMVKWLMQPERPAMVAFEVAGAYITLIHNDEHRARENRGIVARWLAKEIQPMYGAYVWVEA